MPDVNRYGGGSSTSANFASFLPLVYAGHPNRIQRYYQFDDMDRDSDINACLDTIADFCTQSEEQTEEPFEVHYNSDPNESETKILKTMLEKWVKLNNFRARLWYMFRDTLKNGDAFFLRDPETQEWLWLDHFMVEMVKVDDTMGKKPDEYLIRGLDYNRQTKFGSKQADPNQYRTPYGTSNIGASRVSSVSMSSAPAAFSLAGNAADPRQRNMMGPFSQEVSVVDAQFVIHLSLSIGNDINWPFGTSILEPIFKTFKQKELLEDAIIIYRVQRAPERRIFYVDVGTMPPERAKRHIEMIKNDIHQRRIPNRTGGGASILDAAYNPLCISLDTRIYLVDGRILSLAELIVEYNDGIGNWVYSCDPQTGKITTGPITWAGITRRNAEVVEVILDNGQSFVCTPDHQIPVLGKGYVEAAQLTPQDPLIRFNREDGIVHYIRDVVPVYTNMDVGTITVDKDEKYNPFHNFAIAENIFLKNSINDDYFFAQSADGRGSKVETLPGGEQTGEITDLMFFSRKLARGLRVPVSYLNLGEDDNAGVMFNDGKLGAAMVQEFRFSKYCMRWQSLLASCFDKEFKRYLIKNGIDMEWSLFELRFAPPQSFTRYRQMELDTQRVQVYQGVAENKRLAERFKLKRFLGLSDDELLENEELWAEENAAKMKAKTGASPAESGGMEGLSSVGVRPMGGEMPPEEIAAEGEGGEDLGGAGPGAGAPAAGGIGAAGMPPPPGAGAGGAPA